MFFHWRRVELEILPDLRSLEGQLGLPQQTLQYSFYRIREGARMDKNSIRDTGFDRVGCLFRRGSDPYGDLPILLVPLVQCHYH